MRHKRKEAPAWVFSWRSPSDALIPRIIAVALVTLLFFILLTSVRIRVIPPAPWNARKANAIHVPDDAEGRELRIRAREGGPFPSRFEPADWQPAGEIVKPILLAASGGSRPLPPRLRDLAEATAPIPPQLASRGEAVLPTHTPAISIPAAVATTRLLPVLQPRSGILATEMPETLPQFQGAVEKAVKEVGADSGLFLVRIDGAGNVQDCVALAGQDEAGFGRWMRGVRFRPEKSSLEPRWIVVGLGIRNLPEHGSDPR